MKKWNLVLVLALSLAALPAFADPTSPSFAARTSSLAKSTFGAAQDTAITTYIYAKLASHPSLANSNLDVSTTNGRVTLNGIVNDDKQASEIQQIAANTAGVKSVDASKIIVSVQDGSLYLKTVANTASRTIPASQPAAQMEPVSPPTQAAAETHPLVEASDLKTHSSDPLLADADDRSNQDEPAFESKKPAKHLSHPVKKKHCKKRKTRTAAAKKTRPYAHKKPVPHKRAAHLHPHHKKTLAQAGQPPIKREKRIATQSRPLAEQLKNAHRVSQKTHKEPLKPQQVASQKNNHGSVDQMTSDYLKTALTANQPIPEE